MDEQDTHCERRQCVDTCPRVTVMMPVYNGLPHVRHAIESMLEQEGVTFVILAYDDGSTDGTGDYLDSLDDPRIVVRHQDNMGLAKTLNAMLTEVDSEFVARMDADDVCMPGRFAKQLAFLEAHPDVAVVGSRQGYVAGERSMAEFNFGFRKFVPSYAPPLRNPPYWHPAGDGHILVHSSVMMRTAALVEVGGYPEIVPGQDLALWYKFAHTSWRLANIEEILVLVRISEGGISSSNLEMQYLTWRHIADSWDRESKGNAAVSLRDFLESSPLGDGEKSIMTAKAKLRNAMARFLEGRRISGFTGAIMVLARHPSLFFEKLKSRL